MNLLEFRFQVRSIDWILNREYKDCSRGVSDGKHSAGGSNTRHLSMESFFVVDLMFNLSSFEVAEAHNFVASSHKVSTPTEF